LFPNCIRAVEADYISDGIRRSHRKTAFAVPRCAPGNFLQSKMIPNFWQKNEDFE